MIYLRARILTTYRRPHGMWFSATAEVAKSTFQTILASSPNRIAAFVAAILIVLASCEPDHTTSPGSTSATPTGSAPGDALMIDALPGPPSQGPPVSPG